MILHVGCAAFIGSQQEYLRSFRMVEVQADARPAPKLATLRRWRAEAPADFVFTLAAELGEGGDRSIAERAEAIDARIVVVRTPTHFTPTAANREQLMRFVRGAEGARRMAWEPLGLWQRGDIERLAGELGIIPCIDPMQHKQPLAHEGVAYYRVRGLGSPIGERELERVALACEDLDEVFVVFARLGDALHFSKLVAQP